MDWQLIVPGEPGWGQADMASAREVRLRPGQPVTVILPGGVWRGSHVLTSQEITQAAQALSGYSLAAYGRELSRGFLPLPGGHRLGVCGEWGSQGLRHVFSLCVRVAHEVKGAGEALFPQIRGKSCLIAGPPGAGKTTLLRDLIRLYAENGFQVGVADCRGEIAACREGEAQLDVGPMTDVVTGLEKAPALDLLIRAMAPQVIAVDETGGEAEAAALLEAAKSGVKLLFTAHGKTVEDVKKRRGLDRLFQEGVIEAVALLSAVGAPPRVTFMKKEGAS